MVGIGGQMYRMGVTMVIPSPALWEHLALRRVDKSKANVFKAIQACSTTFHGFRIKFLKKKFLENFS